MPNRTGSRGIVGFFLSLITVGLLVVGPTPGRASFPGANGKIAFASIRDGDFEIHVMNPDGTDVLQLTDNSAVDRWPAWSPDGTKIAFTSERDGNREIYVMNADGSGVTRLTDNAAGDAMPAWSPDGSQIAFLSRRDGQDDIYVMSADGMNVTRLTTLGSSQHPDWSPDGTRIAFETGAVAGGNRDIFLMNPNGTGLVNFTSTAGVTEAEPDWSPDGAKIVVERFAGPPSEIYALNVVGGGSTNLTNSPEVDGWPEWSPDGTKIAFLRNSDIYVMSADGSAQTRITDSPGLDTEPAWQPLAVPPPPGSAMDDNFDDNSLDLNRWDVFSPPGGSVVEQNQRLEIVVPSGFQGQAWGLRSRCSLGGDFDVQVDFAILDWPPGNLFTLRLGALDLALETGILRVSTPDDSVYALVLDPSGIPVAIAHTTDQTGSLRLVRSGSTLSGYYRQGETWVLLGSGGTSVDPTRISIHSGSETPDAPPGRMAFDNFKVNADSVVCPPPPPATGTIIIDKVTNPSGDPQTFDFTLTGGPSGLNQSFSLTDEGVPHNSGPLPPGSGYSVTETPLTGWDPAIASCSDGSPVTDIGLAAGETVTCTFANTKRGSITIAKDTVPNNPRDFAFTGSFGAFSLDADDNPALPNQRDFTNLPPGSYFVGELLDFADWQLTGIACNDLDGGTTMDLPGRAATIDLDPGQRITCIFTNSRGGTITIVKNAVPDDAQDFRFRGDLGRFSLDNDDDPTLSNLQLFERAVGSYSVREQVLSGWRLTEIFCSDPDGGTTTDLTFQRATIDLDLGESITCFFTNTRPSQQYVALGDSFSSGTGTGLYDLGTGQDGNECYRSHLAYPRVFAAAHSDLTITHVACSGARIGHVLTDSKGGEPPQVSVLSPDIDLVTLTIGGNDIEFDEVIQACVLIFVACHTQFDLSTLIADVRTRLPSAYREVRSRARDARIFVVGYPQIIPDPRTLPLFDPCLTGIERTEMTALRRWGEQLNDAIRDAAADVRRSGDRQLFFVNVSDAFRGREICTGEDRLVNEVTVNLVESFHPNTAGHSRLSECVERAVFFSELRCAEPRRRGG